MADKPSRNPPTNLGWARARDIPLRGANFGYDGIRDKEAPETKAALTYKGRKLLSKLPPSKGGMGGGRGHFQEIKV